MQFKSMKNKITAIVFLCGIIPVSMIVVFLINSYRHGLMDETRIKIAMIGIIIYLVFFVKQQTERLFEYTHKMELSQRDAKIMMLQAQINPHFLNNTLETMNWQARIAGDMEVSAMIEALGVVLDFGMNREMRYQIRLEEELKCVDAYFYIISKRFGSRLQIRKEIDETLLSVDVPQLILQPLVENAVEHGMRRSKQAVVILKIYRDEHCIVLQVFNCGNVLTDEDRAKIACLLDLDNEAAFREFGNHNSLAIRNINERIKLIYGMSAGLAIEQRGEDVVSTVTIPTNR